jgi:hypothetical protein
MEDGAVDELRASQQVEEDANGMRRRKCYVLYRTCALIDVLDTSDSNDNSFEEGDLDISEVIHIKTEEEKQLRSTSCEFTLRHGRTHARTTQYINLLFQRKY